MRRIHFHGQTREMSERSFLLMLEGIAGGIHSWARRYFGQVGGFPDVPGMLRAWDQEYLDLEQQESIISQIEDEELQGLFRSLDRQMRTIEAFDAQFVELIAKFFDLPAPQTQRNRQKLLRRMGKNAPFEGPVPVWAAQPEYQQLAEQSRQVFAAIDEIKRRIDGRLAQLLTMTADEPEAMELPSPAPSGVLKRLIRPRN